MMKYAIFLIIFISFACGGRKAQNNSDLKSSSTNIDERLIGIWNSDMNDLAAKDRLGNVTMTFTKNGSLYYDIYEGNKLQRIIMTYRISGDTIISDQPSHPNQERTKYKLETNDKLILEFEGTTSVFRRVTN